MYSLCDTKHERLLKRQIFAHLFFPLFIYFFLLRNFCSIFDGLYNCVHHSPSNICLRVKCEEWGVKRENARTSIKITIWLPFVDFVIYAYWTKMMMINVHRHKMKGKRFTLFNFNCVLFSPAKCMEKLLFISFSRILWHALLPASIWTHLQWVSLLFIISLFAHRSELASFLLLFYYIFSYSFCEYI